MFCGIWQMGMNDRPLIDKINPTLIALIVMAIHHCLSAWKTGEFKVLSEFGPGGGAQRKCNTRSNNHMVDTACTDVYHHLNVDFCSSLPEVQAKKIDNICSMIHQRIHSTGMDPAIAQPHNDQGSFDENFLDYVPEELIEQPDNSFNCLSSFLVAVCDSQLFCLWACLPLPPAASSSPAVTATAMAMTSPTLQTSPALRLQD